MNASECGHDRFHRLREALRADLARYQPAAAFTRRRAPLRLVLTSQVQAAMLHRVSHLLYVRGWNRCAQVVAWANLYLFKLAIDPASCIGDGLFIPRPVGVTFAGSAGADLTLFAHTVCTGGAPIFYGRMAESPRLEDRVSIGAHTRVVGGVRVGHDTRVGFLVTLDRDAPAARVVSSRSMIPHRPRPRVPGAAPGEIA